MFFELLAGIEKEEKERKGGLKHSEKKMHELPPSKLLKIFEIDMNVNEIF